MRTWTRCTLLALGLIALQASSFTGACHAGPFTDWLRGRTPYYYPWNQTVVQRPTVAAYAPSLFQVPSSRIPDRVGFQGGTVFPSRRTLQQGLATPAPAAAPAPMTIPAPGAMPSALPRPPAATYAPATACPPAAACNPCDPCATPAPQPLVSSFRPQVRYRTTWVPVPVTRYRPVMGTDPTTGCPTTAMQPCNTYTWQLRRVPVVQYRPLWGGRRCGAQLFPSCGAAPLAPAMAPTVVSPGGSCCTTPSAGQPYYAPQPGVQLVPGASEGSEGQAAPTPADQKPTLPPETRQQASARPQLPLSSPAAGSATSRGPQTNPTSAEAQRPLPTVRPLPDPDAKDRPSVDFKEPPQLLDPRDRTASRATWAVVPIAWPAPPPTFTAAPETTAKPPVDPTTWNDRGWQSQR
jgi:hypothetical protein